jgi:hypothetical protein
MSWISRTNKSKKLFLLFIVTLGFSMMISLSALAEGDVGLSVKTGIAGEYKSSQWVPVEVTVTNKGEDIEGNLIVEIPSNYEYSGTYYQPVAVAKGATKKVTLLVPGNGLSSTMYVRLMQGNKEIAKQKIGGRNLGSDTLFVGVLATDPNTGNFLATLPKNMYSAPVRVTPLTAEDIPEFAAPLKSLDLLVINNFSVDKLGKSQVQAIKDWTQEGGMLILAGGAHFDKLSGTLASLAPVEIEGVTEVDHLTSIGEVVNKPIDVNEPFTVSQATHHTGQILYQVDQIPIFVLGDAGAGKVLYVAYDLVEEPLASWNGNSEFWGQLLIEANGEPFFNERKMGMMDNWWPLHSAADRLPSLKLPDMTTLAILFAIYVLLVGPVLYFILKRKEKREWTWFIVPLLACTVAVGIYIYGSMERTLNVLVHNVSYVELKDKGQADVKATSAIFVPSGGDYTIRFKDNTMIMPSNQRYGPNNQQASETWVSLTPDQSEVQFKKVEFWSMRKATIQTSIEDVGQFTSNLTYKEGKLVGSVTNNTIYSFRDVKLINGRHVQDVEMLAPGEKAIVELNFDKSFRPGQGSLPIQSLLPQHLQGQNNLHRTREAMMLDMLTVNQRGKYSNQWVSPLTIIGWTEDSIFDYDIVDQTSKPTNLALVKGTLHVEPSSDGYIFYPAGTFEAIQTENTGQLDFTGDGYMMQSGDVTFEFHLYQENRKIDVENIHMYTWSHDGTRFDKKVYNWETEAYEPYDQVFENNNLQGEDLGKYISAEGILRIQMGHSLNGHHHLGQPAISVEGKVEK